MSALKETLARAGAVPSMGRGQSDDEIAHRKLTQRGR